MRVFYPAADRENQSGRNFCVWADGNRTDGLDISLLARCKQSAPSHFMYTQCQNFLTDPERQQEVFADLYHELKSLARIRMAGERAWATMNATALVHEAWLRLENGSGEPWEDKAHFFGAASEAMRRILIEAARRRNAEKRGGGVAAVPIDGIDLPDDTDHQRLLEVNEVLDRLESEDPMKAQIVKMRFYCGMENEEIAAILGVNEKTVRRHWEVAKVWLFRAIQEGD